MNNLLSLIPTLMLAGAAGGLLGLLFFGGLWWTVRRAVDSPRPALWVGGSLLLRMACVAAGFVVVSAGDWRNLVSCLLGFWAARWWVLRLSTRVAAEPSAALGLTLKLTNDCSHGAGPTELFNLKKGHEMQIQINTDNHIEGNEALSTHVEAVVENAVRHMKDQLTRVEVHLDDENGGKPGSEDKRCLMEARLRSHQPVAVSHHAGSVHQAVDGAARKLRAALESLLGRLDEHRRHSPAEQPDLTDPT